MTDNGCSARRLGGGCGFCGGGRLRCLLGARLALLARDRPVRVVARFALHDAGLVQKAQHAIGGQRAFRNPRLGLVEVELDALGFLLRQERIEKAEPLDEATVAGRTAVGNHDVIKRPFLGTGTCETNSQRHWGSLFLTSSFRIRESLGACRRGRAAAVRSPEVSRTIPAAPGEAPAAVPRRAVPGDRKASSPRASASARGSACRRPAPACWQARPSVRACRRPSPSSGRPWCGAS